MVAGGADLGPGLEAEDLHDAGAVQVRTDGVERLLLGEVADARRELVVARLKPADLAAVLGRHVRANEAHEMRKQVPGVAHETAHGRIGPSGLRESEGAQVELDEPRHVLLRLLVEAQRRHPLGRHARADDVVGPERDRSVFLETPRARLADVVEEGGQPQRQVGARKFASQKVRLVLLLGRGVLEGDRLIDDGECVLVDVLVAIVLVRRVAQPGDLGKDDVGHAGVDEQLDSSARRGREHEPFELGPDPLGGDDREALGHLGHGGHDVLAHVEPQLRGEAGRAHDPQGVVVEGLNRGYGGSQNPADEVVEAAARVDQLKLGQPNGHGVDGEVAPREVALESAAEVDLRFARADLVRVGPIRGHLHSQVVADGSYRAELSADVPGGGTPRREELLGDFRGRRRRQIEVVNGQSEEGVADRPSHE